MEFPNAGEEFPSPGFEHGVLQTPGSSIEFPNPGFEHRVPEPRVRTHPRVPEPQGLNIDFKLQGEPGFDKFEPRVQP